MANGFGQAQGSITIPTICNTSSPSGNVLIMSGGAETVVPGCDISGLTTTSSSVTIQINFWFSQAHTGVLKHATARLYRGSIGGTLLASQGFGDINSDPTDGHAQNWSTSVVDSSPGSEYTLTIEEDTNPSGSNIWSDTRTFCIVGAVQPTVSAYGQAQTRVVTSSDCNSNSTGNVLIVTGTTETILPGCDLLVLPTAAVDLSWNVWISHNNNGTFKRETLAIKRDNVSGATLASFDTGASDGGDSNGGHQFNWTGTFTDSSPTTGHYVLTTIETAAGVGTPANTQTYSDTRTFCATVKAAITKYGLAQANILAPNKSFAQSQADIKQTYQGFGQAQTKIIYRLWSFGQVNAYIYLKRSSLGQAQADILHTSQDYAQAQALIAVRNINAFGQAQASIVYKRWAFSQAQAYVTPGNPDGGGGGGGQPLSNYGPPQYVVVYDGFQLPGYPQHEAFDSSITIVDNDPFGWDGAMSQQVGLVNGHIQIDFLIYEASGWHQAKNNYHDAARIVMAEREDFAPLYIDYRDRHWLAKPQDIDYQKDATQSRKTLPYTVHWEILPWAIGEEKREITGATGTLVTTGRTLASGAWTPTIVTVTGTNVTVSGYTDTEFTGYITISGIVTDMVLDTEAYTVEINGVSALNHLYRQDFGLFVGVGETKFKVAGASAISIKYTDRWF